MQAIATAQDEQNGGKNMSAALRKENGHGYEIVPPIPRPEENLEGKLYDPQGNTVSPAFPTLMARIDNRVTEKVELSKGTLWLLGAGVVIINLAFLFGGSMLSWARQDQTQIERQTQQQADMQKLTESQLRMEQRFDKLDDRLREQERFMDRVGGFRSGVAESQTKEHK